jgi:hypothetical protein
MIKVNYPAPAFRIKKEGGREMIFDEIRKQWLVLTNEEWVRQNFIQYLIKTRQYPAELIAVEKEIQLGELKKRFDILVYNKEHKPWMLVECKAGEINLDEKVIEQVLRYHLSVPAAYLVITNGHFTCGWGKSKSGLTELAEIPELI